MRRRKPRDGRTLFSDWRPRLPSDSEGTYATRSVIRWIMADPATTDECRLLCDAAEAGDWFQDAVRREEVSASYAAFLLESINIEWPLVLRTVKA